jgi:hypothetical protein
MDVGQAPGVPGAAIGVMATGGPVLTYVSFVTFFLV